ncbi:Response regulator receiver domain-containing protein [Chryseolinea serpens]|uniref:Response regulator receiver domain-containing protein n=1 Tax=Chryseolinea serpens TaxID=947013 RepID=A0A1M5RDQ8_9BACT|nr:response regulator [Chryseolinea serpens]SHH24176.1 Response regulator receiver domain-containing protein [Chryseolinea serpens]
MIRKRVINIMLIEDDSTEQIEVKRTLDKRHILYRLQVAKNAEEAMRLLDGEPAGGSPGIPDFILLDLTTPEMDGFGLLRWIRADGRWKDIKVFILTTSDRPADKAEAQALGVSGFVTKPFKLHSASSMDAFNLMMDLMNM